MITREASGSADVDKVVRTKTQEVMIEERYGFQGFVSKGVDDVVVINSLL